MAELVNIVRSADAFLMARAALDDAVRVGSGWFPRPHRGATTAAHVERAASSAHHATGLAVDAGLVGTSMRDAANAVQALAASAAAHPRDLATAVAGPRAALEAAYATVVASIDGAALPADPSRHATWQRAAALVRSGTELPPFLRDTALANADALRTPAAELAPRIAGTRVDEMAAVDLEQLARLVRGSRDVAPFLPELTSRQAAQLERAARLVERGIELPANWALRPALHETRGRLLWGTLADARTFARDLLWQPRGTLSGHDVEDLRAIARLPDDLRPEAFPAGLPDGPVPEALLQQLRRGTADASTIETVRGHLHRVATDFANKLATPQENYRDVLGPLRTELLRFVDLPLEGPDRQLADGALQLVERNIARQEGRLGGQYGKWTDLAELGRVRTNLDTIEQFGQARERAADVAEQAAAAPAAEVADDAASSGEKLTW